MRGWQHTFIPTWTRCASGLAGCVMGHAVETSPGLAQPRSASTSVHSATA